MNAPSKEWAESIPSDESARFERYASELRAMALQGARALHAKANAGLEAELTTLADVPAHAKVGIFAAPATYRAWVRFSNGAGRRQKDAKPDVRGVAIKIAGVPGKKLIPGMEDAKTQDLLFIKTPSTPVRDADEFFALVRAAQSPALLPFKLIGALGLGRGLAIVSSALKSLGKPTPSLATTRYFTAVPMQWGPYAAKCSLVPHEAPNGAKQPADLGAELADRLRRGPVTYDLRVQFFVDATKTPIEDASVEWLESDAPFVTVARLVLPKQDPASDRGQRVASFVESLSFDPWHAPVEFKPLGNMMRARNPAYRESTKARAAAKEPDGSERFD